MDHARLVKTISTNRILAKEFHNRAEILEKNGDYETALIFYHRATKLYPRDVNHSIAAKRISRLISLTTTNNFPNVSFQQNNSQRKRGKNNGSSQQRLDDKLQKESFFRKSKKLEKGPAIKTKLQQLKKIFGEGNWIVCLRIGNELLAMAKNLSSRYDSLCYQFTAHRYLTLTHLSMGRHDRAVSQSSKLIEIGKMTGNIKVQSKACAILGRVHLSFGHLDAAAKAWYKLSRNINEAIPKAWILHEIGNCYFEMGKYTESLDMAKRCCEWADEVYSIKWLYHGKLLAGQSFIKLGRFTEALEYLQNAATDITKCQDNNLDILYYIENLIKRVIETLRINFNEEYDTLNPPLVTLTTHVIRGSKDRKYNHTSTFTTSEKLPSHSSSCQVIDKWKSLLREKKENHILQPTF